MRVVEVRLWQILAAFGAITLSFVGGLWWLTRLNDATHAQARHNRHTAACLSTWANATTSRTSLLTQRASDRSNRLDTILRHIAAPTRSRRQFRRDLHLYIVASDAYNAALKNHPIPKPTSVRC